jgi:hypothetical protein
MKRKTLELIIAVTLIPAAIIILVIDWIYGQVCK